MMNSCLGGKSPEVCPALATLAQRLSKLRRVSREVDCGVELLQNVCSVGQVVVVREHDVRHTQLLRIAIDVEHVVEGEAAVTATAAIFILQAVVESQPEEFACSWPPLIEDPLLPARLRRGIFRSRDAVITGLVSRVELLGDTRGVGKDVIELGQHNQSLLLCPVAANHTAVTAYISFVAFALHFANFGLQEPDFCLNLSFFLLVSSLSHVASPCTLKKHLLRGPTR
mmetsp:Transcript_20891/g.46032  ORF Transcript_20891/g.46032 Transcript_20891/m.46032 type:complete len:227 (+) Transcript_20891:1296-1976(+)